MAIRIEMPKLSDTMSEGKVLSWKKKEGDEVAAGEILAEIESDKANMEMEAYDAGFVRRLLVPEGGSAPVGALIAILTETADEALEETVGSPSQAGKAPGRVPEASGRDPEAVAQAAPSETAHETPGATNDRDAHAAGSRRVLASPLAFRMAAEAGIDLAHVSGSGPAGRVTKRDIERARAAGTSRQSPSAGPSNSKSPAADPKGNSSLAARAASAAGPSFEDVPVSSMRKTIASRLVESKTQAPHFYVTVDVDMRAAARARRDLNEKAGLSVTFTDMVIKAAALALARHPEVNSSWRGETIRRHRSVDIGVAVSIPDGLVTPVLRACQAKGLALIGEELKILAERARERKLQPDEYRGGTFTVSNLGMFGVKEFTAIINPPESCILAVGAVREEPIVEAGAVLPGLRMSVTLSCDHRVVDGASAARFLKDFRDVLEAPLGLAL